MRRFLALFLALLVPMQMASVAWSMTAGHRDITGHVAGLHLHHDDAHHHHTDESSGDDSDSLFAAEVLGWENITEHDSDGHHQHHYHPVLMVLLLNSSVHLSDQALHDPPSGPLPYCASHIPLPLDWPPAALA